MKCPLCLTDSLPAPPPETPNSLRVEDIRDATRYRKLMKLRLGFLSRRAPLAWAGQTPKEAMDKALDAIQETA